MKTTDVVIVGAGLAGLQCARLLARRGLRVVLVDRKRSLEQSIHTTGIFVRRTLEDFDIPTDCLGPPLRHVTLYSPSRRTMELASPHDEFRIGRMGHLYNRYLDHCLLAGVEWLPETRYAGHSLLKDGLAIRLESNSSAITVNSSYVIGADGANSRVAKQLELETNSEWIVGVESVFKDLEMEGPPRLHCFLDPKIAPGYLAWVAYDGEEAHVGVGGYPGLFDPAQALEQFRGSLNGIIDLSKAKQTEHRSGRIPVGGVLRNIANTHGLLIGDAAGAVSPLTAGGLDPCMRLSTLAANVVAEYLHSQDERVLRAYSGDVFRARFTSRLWMRRIAAAVRHRGLIELGCATLRLPIFNRMAWQVFFGRGSFPDVNFQSLREVAVGAD